MSGRELKYIAGDHWVVCDRSGLTYRRSEMVREPKTGFWVHRSEVDPPHPQQYRTPVRPDRQNVFPVRMNLLGRDLGPGGELPSGDVSTLPQIGGGAIDEDINFLDTNEVDPTSF